MRLYTIEASGRERVCAELAGELVDLAAAHAAMGGREPAELASMLALIRAGDAGLALAREALDYAERHPEQAQLRHPMGAARLRAPLPRPGKILCSGVNYRSHKDENPDAVLPETPGFFSKLPSAVVGPGDPIVHPRETTQLDYEVELAVVIGRTLRKAAEAEALAGVFGYTILHDVSARDVQFKAPQPNQITLGKNFDTFAPLGPCIVTADAIPDPAALRVRTLLNGQVMQDASTAEWLFPLPFLLAFLSRHMTLEPGDIVTTGTPAGVGAFRRPPVWMRPGDLVAVEVEGVGRLENPVVADS